MLNFSQALEAIKIGTKMARKEWVNAKFVFLVDGSTFKVSRAPLNKFYPDGHEVTYRAHIDMLGADGSIGTWAPSMVDILAEDWYTVE